MIFKLKEEGSIDINEEGDLLLIDVWDDTGARIGIIKMYKDGCIELESHVYGSKGRMHFVHAYDFFGNVNDWYVDWYKERYNYGKQ